MKTFLRAILGGGAIATGGVIYLTMENQVIGAFLFSIGLFTIYTFGLHLYTGKVCHILHEKPGYLLTILLVYAGNFIGAAGTAFLLRQTKLSSLIAHAQEMANHKLDDTLFSAFVVSILCGVMMSIAVLGFTTIQDSVGRHLALILPIMVFILSGYEHSIADIFYFSMANVWSGYTFLYLLIITLGNLVGGNILPCCQKFLK